MKPRSKERLGNSGGLLKANTVFGLWLHIAASYGRIDIANYIIDCKIDVNRRGKDMEFHYELLEETRKEIKDIRFFREDVALNAEEYEVIHDYDEAYENAFRRFYEYGEHKGQTWVDILEENARKLWGMIYKRDNYAELDEIVMHIEIPELDDIEFPIEDISVEQEMYEEIILCAQSRFVCGKENAFFESLFKAYILGGWPCGWKNGKIIVYVPSNK